MLKNIAIGFGTAALAFTPLASQAAVSFSGVLGSLAASVTFDALPGSQLKVVLTNTSTADVLVPADVLTAVFFNGLTGLTSVSATLTAGSTVIYDSQPAGGVVGGEWGYGSGLAGAPGGATGGISSSGLGGVFGAPTFPGADLESPPALDGLQYGILSAGDNTATGNGGITGSGGLIKNSVTFVLGNYTGGTAGLSSITNVSFQYGTALNEPNIPGGTCPNGAPNFPLCNFQVVETPEPMSMALLGIGLLGLGTARLRRRPV